MTATVAPPYEIKENPAAWIHTGSGVISYNIFPITYRSR